MHLVTCVVKNNNMTLFFCFQLLFKVDEQPNIQFSNSVVQIGKLERTGLSITTVGAL